MNEAPHTNKLVRETSPYLLQHAHNPVDWHPWNEEALARARTEDRPILLSIGYAACHWCHVMAHESFEDPDTAALMNKLFVNVKVDREERPDLDRIYQLAHQLIAQRGGGWPLTVFLTPGDLTPFFAGTYFPPTTRYGMPPFREVLARVEEFYRQNRQQLTDQNAQLLEALARIGGTDAETAESMDAAPIGDALGVLLKSFDPRDGGFGRAPKFPHTSDLELLLHISGAGDVEEDTRKTCRHMASLSLRRMAEGGIYDHLGGGFCRYSVDNSWSIPHFEKMLYDNGSLLTLYAQAWRLTGEGLYRRTADETAAWVMREMQSPEGGYYSSLDADSERQEGKYYVWDREEVRGLLDEQEFAAFAARYGLDDPANFEERWWHLRISLDLARKFPSPRVDSATELLLDGARVKLLAARDGRVCPGLDDKVLTAWNGLMIRGMASSGRLLQRQPYIDSAAKAADFIESHLWKDGRLYASWRSGEAKLPAYLDDHAFLLAGLLELLQAEWDSSRLAWARKIADAMLDHFEDKERGGFWFTADDQPTPLFRPKTFSDESMPAGNAVAARSLIGLGHLCAEPRYLDAAERTLRAAYGVMQQYPESHAAMLLALEDMLAPPTMVVLRGSPDTLADWREELVSQYDPRRLVLAIPADAKGLTGLLSRCLPRGEACAYVCRGTTCSLPVTSVASLSLALSSG
ncbi:MAG TPA: thioredoxin domain-containing protein [Gammaproteobacteria bacterium]|nr:thioredoxin domain-containing protein [Gammaproteobacteria bacterium]